MSAYSSLEERLHLQSNLKEGLSFKEISCRLGKDPSTISREVDQLTQDDIDLMMKHISSHIRKS